MPKFKIGDKGIVNCLCKSHPQYVGREVRITSMPFTKQHAVYVDVSAKWLPAVYPPGWCCDLACLDKPTKPPDWAKLAESDNVLKTMFIKEAAYNLKELVNKMRRSINP